MSARSVSLFVALAFATSACTSTEIVAPRARTALGQSTSDDFVHLPTAGGGTVDFGPNATLVIQGRDATEVSASDLYTNEEGLFQKDGELISTWDDLRGVTVKQLDGAATVAVTATVAVAVVALAAILKSSPSGGGSKGGSSGSSGSAPKAPPVRSAPNPSSVAPDPGLTEVMFRTAEAAANANPNGPSVAVGVPDDEPEPTTAMPLFSRGARRRANVRVLGRLEGGLCWPGGGSSGDCVVSGARAGVRLLDIFELTGGVRVESNAARSQPLAVLGAMLHGEAPSARWFALAAGASVAFDGERAHVVPEVAIRFRPVRGLWIGLVPVEPVYRSEDGGWSMASGVELSGEL